MNTYTPSRIYINHCYNKGNLLDISIAIFLFTLSLNIFNLRYMHPDSFIIFILRYR